MQGTCSPRDRQVGESRAWGSGEGVEGLGNGWGLEACSYSLLSDCSGCIWSQEGKGQGEWSQREALVGLALGQGP